MTYDNSRKADARVPVTAVEIYIDDCAESFGVGACTASGAAGTECYNTYLTCQDPANYNKTQKTYRFYQPVSNWPIGEIGYPALKEEPKYTSCKIDPKGSLGKRGSVRIELHDFADDDLYTDPYVSTRTYTPELQGTFFGKLKSRTPYYKGRLMKVRKGYINNPFSWSDFEDRLYVIESISYDQKGKVIIEGKDLLKLTEDKKSVAPAVSTATLASAYTAAGTTLVLQTGEGAAFANDIYTGSAISGSVVGYVRIGDNVLKYTGVSTDTLTGVVGGQFGSSDENADIDDAVQKCLNFDAVNVIDIIHFLLTNYADINESYIPYDAGLTTPTGTDDEWDIEKGSWLSSNTLTHIITESTGVATLLKQICEQNLIYMWFNEKDQEVKLRAIAPELKNATPLALTDNANILEDSIMVSDNVADRISQIWIYYDLKNIAGDTDKAENYKKIKITVDTDSENINAYSEKAIRVIYANWLGSSNTGLILTLTGRLLSRYAGTPSTVKFKVDMADADLWTGSIATLQTNAFQAFDGSNLTQKMQVLKASEIHDKQIAELEAETWEYEISRYGFVTPNTMGDYTAESAENQNAYGFICQNDGYYTNGDKGHLIA